MKTQTSMPHYLRFKQPFVSLNQLLKAQQGMTLIELTVVLLILTTLATVALRSTTNLVEQARWEQTKKRYEEIKKSIIGNPDLAINGQPDISGFVADMGRLPVNIKELLVQNYCGIDYTETVPGTCGVTWVANPGSFIDCSDGVSVDEVTCLGAGETWHSIRSGWNGPYLISSENSEQEDAFVDGWANLPTVVTDLNYGWVYTPNGGPPPISLNLQSSGCASCDLVDYTNPYPTIAQAIAQDEWRMDISPSITVLIKMPFSGTCSGSTCSNPLYTDQSSCTSNSAAWVTPFCDNPLYVTQTDCETNGANWINASCSNTTHTTKAACEVADIWGIVSKSNCEGGGETWTPASHTLQMVIRYRQEPGTSLTLTSTNSPVLNDDGQFQYVQFDFPVNSFIPMGISLIQILEAGADFQHAGLQVPLFPGHSLSTINW